MILQEHMQDWEKWDTQRIYDTSLSENETLFIKVAEKIIYFSMKSEIMSWSVKWTEFCQHKIFMEFNFFDTKFIKKSDKMANFDDFFEIFPL